MVIMFGSLLNSQKKSIPLLLQCLACIIHHSEKIIGYFVKYPGHDFSKLQLLHNRTLIDDLKEMVTTEPTRDVMEKATGIPPHVQQARLLNALGEKVSYLTEKIEDQATTILQGLKSY